MSTRICSVLLLAPFLSAQSEDYLVTFGQRSFDLSGFCEAIHARRPAAEVATLVTELEQRCRADQEAFVAFVRKQGGTVTRQWWLVNGCALRLPAAAVEKVRAHPRVSWMAKDELRAPGWIKTATDNKNHHTDAVHAKGLRGKGVTVAIIDSGLDAQVNTLTRPHRTFFPGGSPNNTSGPGLGGSRLLANVKVGALGPDDVLGHGTAVAGVAVGADWGTSAADDGHAPEATVVGYCIADQSNGSALISTMVQAFQQMAADKVKYNTQVANLSYLGTDIANWIEQRAMDAAALNADILITVLSGNSGGNTHYSHAATNVISVGAAEANLHDVPTFSGYGILASPRQVPDLVANGVNIIGPYFDDENRDGVSTGTSQASPQVAGAAALYRSVRTSASALETRAALLATTEDVRWANTGSLKNSGEGYLRDDLLVDVALGKGMVQNSQVTPANPQQLFSLPVSAGKSYAVALVWNRHDLSLQSAWSDMQLGVSSGGTPIALADSRFNTYEKLVFTATGTGTLTLRARATRFASNLQSLPFALVATEMPHWEQPGYLERFGTSCPGSVVFQGQPLGFQLSLGGRPALSGTLSLTVAALHPQSLTMLAIGRSKSSWAGANLPLDLSGLGAPNCQIYVSLDVLVPGVAQAAGSTSIGSTRYTLPIPNNASLIGRTFYLQAAGQDRGANALQMVTTNAYELRIGRF